MTVETGEKIRGIVELNKETFGKMSSESAVWRFVRDGENVQVARQSMEHSMITRQKDIDKPTEGGFLATVGMPNEMHIVGFSHGIEVPLEEQKKARPDTIKIIQDKLGPDVNIVDDGDGS